MISYKKLFHILLDRDMSKGDLQKLVNISPCTMAKLSNNKSVSLEIIERLCIALECQPSDILEIIY